MAVPSDSFVLAAMGTAIVLLILDLSGGLDPTVVVLPVITILVVGLLCNAVFALPLRTREHVIDWAGIMTSVVFFLILMILTLLFLVRG